MNDLFGEKTQWTEESIRQFVKDNNIKTRYELQTKAVGAYVAALKFGLLNDLFGEKELKWTEESIRQFVKDNNIKTRKELVTKAPGGAYDAARRLGILNDLFGEKTQWTEENIRQFVKDNNIKTRSELQTKAKSAYDVALKFGLLDDLFGENKAKERNYWTEESIKQFVKDNNIKTRSELEAKACGAYATARRLGILDDLFGEKI